MSTNLKAQTLSVRLLRESRTPDQALRGVVPMSDWPTIKGAKIALGTDGGGAPKWTSFLGLSEQDKAKVKNATAYGLVFIPAEGRWFVISFGLGHVKLNPEAFEHDFGLRVVLNTVDPAKLKSLDVRTPDDNTLCRRSQTSRGSDQTAFSIDVERDILRGLVGTPKDQAFATRVAGSDALSINRKLEIHDLPNICADAYAAFQRDDYKANFGWIDQVRHIRDVTLINTLDSYVVNALQNALTGHTPDTLHLAYPVIYEPEKGRSIRYKGKGFRSINIYHDLDLHGYIAELQTISENIYTREFLNKHKVHEVDDDGNDLGRKWRLRECLVFEKISMAKNTCYPVIVGTAWSLHWREVWKISFRMSIDLKCRKPRRTRTSRFTMSASQIVVKHLYALTESSSNPVAHCRKSKHATSCRAIACSYT